MMAGGIEELTEQEREFVKNILRSLIESLRDKRAHGMMIPDEEFILSGLTHPERGDVKITILREKKMEVFLSNRRDETYPFAVMNSEDVREFSDRKFIDGVRNSLKEGQYGLFLISQQDQHRISSSSNKVESFSSFFNINESVNNIQDEFRELKTKSLEHCNLDDKWIIYKRGWEMDNRLAQVEKELFGFKIVYAKYKQKYNEELIIFSPKKYRERIGQLVRDIYPPNVRISLRRDFPKDHKKYVEETHRILKSLLRLIDGRIENQILPDGYKSFLLELKSLFNTIITNDPDLSGFA